MQLIRILSEKLFKDTSVVGLSGLRKSGEYVKVTIPEDYKRTFVSNTERNYLLL